MGELRAPLGSVGGEAVRVHPLRGNLERVSRRARDERRADVLPELRHVDLDAVPGTRRRLVPPEIVDDPIDRQDLARVQREVREERPGPGTAERQRFAVPPHLERAEQQNLKRAGIGQIAPRPSFAGGCGTA